MDINNDDIINVVDVVSAVNYILGTTEFDSCELFAADVNCDRIINVVDIITIVATILSL